MNFNKPIRKRLTTLIVTAAMSLSCFTPMTVHAETTAELNPVSTATSFYDPNYVPFRSHYGSYLATFSCAKGDVVKKIWERLFYEELTENGDYKKWSDKYYDNYGGLAGKRKSTKGLQITYSEGDFEAFLGNTLKNNPEFLGELMGLDGYEKVADDSSINALMREVICNYLISPSKYPNLALAIVELTADGSYIGESKADDKNILKNHTYNDMTLDLFVLTSIAAYYECDEKETYLNDLQVDWLKSYQQYLFEEYVTKSADATDGKSLAATYPSLYELIARSSYAANSTSTVHPASEFFNYVVESKTGEGAWLNLIDDVDIKGLDAYDDICAIFNFSMGYCHNHQYEIDEACLDSQACQSIEDGGQATEVDDIAYQLHASESSMKLIKQNESTNIAYTNPSSKDGAWLERFTYRHPGKDKPAPVPFYNVPCKIVTGGNSNSGNQGAYDTSYEMISVHAETRATATITLAKVNEELEEQPLSKATAVTINWGGNDSISMYDWDVYIDGVKDTSGKVKKSGNTFNIEKLTWEERQACVIHAYLHASCHYAPNPYDSGDGKPHRRQGCIVARLNTSPMAILSVRRSDCFIEKHDWEGFPTWSDDYSTAVINYKCANDSMHEQSVTVNTTCEDMGNYYLYTAESKYILKKDGTYDSYSTRVYKTKKESTETIALDSNNTNGNISSKVVSDNVIYPAGSKSKETWKCADTSIDFGVESGLIDVGAKSITLNMKVSQTLTNISIVVYSKTGEPLSWNDNSAHPFTCYLYGIPDSKLRGAYIQVIANCSTKNITENYAWYNGVEPATAVASLQANSITINY